MAENGRIWGRRVPSDWKHVQKYPYSAVAATPVATVERTLKLPEYRVFYDQKSQGACVGFGSSWMMSILNRRKYDARWLWDRAKEVDEWTDTNPGDNQGTSVRAAMDVLRKMGHVRVLNGLLRAEFFAHDLATLCCDRGETRNTQPYRQRKREQAARAFVAWRRRL